MGRVWYEVIYEDNFYDGMYGVYQGETPRTVILKFEAPEPLGGDTVVHFYKEQVRKSWM